MARVYKKLRLGEEEEEIQFSDERDEKVFSPFSDYDDNDEGDDEIDDEERKQYKKFMKEYNINLGFDIQTFLPKLRRSDPVVVMRVDIFNESDPIYLHCVKAVRSVLKHLDEKEEQSLELYKIIRANYRGSYIFFATFDAKDKNTGVIQTYQSMVYRHFDCFETILYIFKKEGDPIDKEEEEGEVDPAFFDERPEYEFKQIKGPYFATYNCKLHQQKLKECMEQLDKYGDENDKIHSTFNSKEYDQKLQLYLKEYNESEGFDIQHFVNTPGCVRPLSRANKIIFNHCTEAVTTVLNYLKEKDELNLQLLRVIKANVRNGYMYYVTFEAKNENSGEIKVYQSVIFHERYSSIETAVYMLRVKEGEVVLPVEDLRNQYESGKAKTIDIKGFHIVNKTEQDGTGTELFEDCEMALKDVLEYLSSKDRKKLKLVKITTAMYKEHQEEYFYDDGISYTFFITFEAKKQGFGTRDISVRHFS